MVRVQLAHFFKTGEFGPVKLGMTRAELEAALGPPEGTGGTSRKYSKPSIWFYGDIEFHFQWPGDDLLCLIHMDDFEGLPSGGRAIDLDPWIIRGGLSREEAEAAFLRTGIAFEELAPIEENFVRLSAGVGVGLVFAVEAEDYSSPPGLCSVSYYTAPQH